MLQQIFHVLDLTTVLTFLFVLLVSVYLWNSLFSVEINIRGPRPWPIVGNVPDVARAKDFGKYLLELRDQYGDMVLLRFGAQPVVVCFGYQRVKEAFLTQGEKSKFRPVWLNIVSKLFKTPGIFFTNGQPWVDGRRFTVVALKDFGVGKKTLDDRINEEVNFLVELISRQQGKPFEIRKILPKATANIISNIIFGSRFDYDDPVIAEMLSHVDFFFKSVSFAQPENFFPILDKVLPQNKLTQASSRMSQVRAFIRTKIDEHRADFDPQNIRSFIDLYLEQEGKSDSKVTEDFLFQAIADLYNAGTDTTAVTISWCILYMLEYPDVQKKCREEILKVVGDGRMLTSKDKETLPYVMATVREIQRKATITQIAAPHCTYEDIYLDGKLIPKKTIIIGHLRSVLQDPLMWEEPNKFNPNRFLDKDGKLIKPEAFIPFSMGPRMCLGHQLATNEVFIFLASLLQRFELCKADRDVVLTMEGIQTGISHQPLPFEVRFKPI